MAEMDLVIEHPDRLEIVEVKSSETATSRLFGGVKRVRTHLESASKRCESRVVYGGSEAQRRSEAELVPWTEVDRHPWAS